MLLNISILIKYTLIKNRLLIDLSKIKCGSVTTDSLTSISNTAYLGVTFHYIDHNFFLISKTLCLNYLEEDHYSDYLFEQLMSVLKEWNLAEKVNFKKSFRNIITLSFEF